MAEQIWFHIDVNSAYLSWSAVDELAAGMDRDLKDNVQEMGFFKKFVKENIMKNQV